MKDSSRLENLLTSLGMEILSARDGSREGQFPILDLLDNLRDEAGNVPGLTELGAFCQTAWERMAGIVAAGQAFTPAEIQWLKDLLTRLRALAKPESADLSPPPPR